MAKKASVTSVVAQPKSFHRCLVETNILCIEHEYSRALGPGAIVDLEESVGPGLKLGDFVREEWFETVPPSARMTDEERNDGARDRS